MRAGNLVSRILLSSVAVLLAAATVHVQETATTTTSEDGTLFKLQLKAKKLKSVTVSQVPATTITGTTQCPGIGTPQFIVDFTEEFSPVNDLTQYFDGVHTAPVLDITHQRVTITETYNGNKLVNRQDWTRVKENENGIDNLTGVRHYIGNFLEETQTPGSGPGAGTPVITAESQGEMTLLEPIFFSTGPLAGITSRVDVVQFIGPQASWLEPFQVADARQCSFLSTGTVQPVNPFYKDHCVANGNQSITYNGVTFTGNIVGCEQSTWP